MTKKQVSKVVEPTPVVEEVKIAKVGIGSTVIDLILKNPEMTNNEILAKIKEQFESSQTSYACIAWYKSKLRKEGKIGARVFKKKEQQQVTE